MREWGFETVVEENYQFKLYRPKDAIVVGTKYHKWSLYDKIGERQEILEYVSPKVARQGSVSRYI